MLSQVQFTDYEIAHWETMLSPLHILAILVIVSIIIPLYRIIRRTGHSGWWCVLLLIPVANWIFVWLFAFVPWPAVDRRYN
ncbi:MAG: hypothetical protein ACREJM_00645 [Candidatus Saccharimonadales bacterium]